LTKLFIVNFQSKSLTGCLLSAILTLANPITKASDLPTVKAPFPDLFVAPGSVTSIDLRDYFEITGISGQVVQFQVSYGTTNAIFNVEMLPTAPVNTVSNFLSYVNSGKYGNTFVHRADPVYSIIQGGGYVSPNAAEVVKSAPIALEYSIPNTRGTMAMARTASPNSATSEWFINGRDNTTTFGPANGGGYAVFGRVTGTGMSVVDAISALPTYNIGSGLTQFPLSGYSGSGSVLLTNTVTINSAKVAPVYPAPAGGPSVMNFSGTISNPTIISASTGLSGSILSIVTMPNLTGSTTFTMRASDGNGNNVTSPLNINVFSGWHYVKSSTTANAFIGGKRTAIPSNTYEYFNYYKGTDNKIWAIWFGGGQWNQVALSQTGNVDDWLTENTTYKQLYYKGTDNHIYAVWYGAGAWNQVALTGTANAAGELQTDSSTNFTYYRGTDNNLWVLWYGAGRWNQAPLTSSGRVVADVVVDSTYHFAYYRGSDSQMWVVWFGAGKWNEAQLSTTANVTGNLLVDPGWGTYYHDGSNGVWAVWFTGSQWAQSSLGVTAGPVSGTTSLYGRLGALYTGTDGVARYLGHNGSNWGFSPLGLAGLNLRDTINFKPADGLIYARTADGHLGFFYYR
jgi:cyclophilin family peptidyl-prolyl cis-trans isomerase